MIPMLKNKQGTSAVAIAVALACSPQGYAQDSNDEGTLEEIVITGSRIRTGRQAPSIPIDTVSADDIKLSGYQNVEEVLNNMPQFVPSRTASTNSTADPNATGAATLDLRGLGGQRTLVLVNGRRYMFFDSSQRTDINNIPASLIERVEVVTGGASAVYGSDAVGGVVNFILRDDFEGVEIRSQLNQTSEGDGDVFDVSLTLGGNFAGDRGNAVVAFNYLDRDPIMTTDRSFSESVLTDVTDTSGNRVLGPGGSSFVPNGRFTGLPTDPADIAAIPGLDAAYAAAGLTGIDGNGFIPDSSGMTQRPFVRPDDLYNYTLDNFLRIPQERYTLTMLADIEVSDTATVFFEGAYSHNRTTTGFAPAFINEVLPIEVANPYISTELSDVLQLIDGSEAGAAANDGLVGLGVRRRLVETGARRNQDTRNAFRALVGLEGSFNNYDYNAYYSYARSDNTQIQQGNVSRAAFASGILSSGGADPIVNPFGPNISAAGVDFIDIAATNVEATELDVFGGTISGDVFEMPAGQFAALVGTEWRSSSVDFTPDEALLTGDVAGFNAIDPASGEIDVWELFAEFRVPLLTDVSGIEALDGTAAYRYSDYDLDQTGGVNTFLLGLDWKVNQSLAFGAQFQRAIRAPSVGEAFGGQRLFPVSASDPCADPSAATDATIRALCEATGVPTALVGDPTIQPNNEIPGLFGGNPNLGEEESDTFTLSAIITPEAIPNLRVSIDYFDIDVEDAIGVFGGSVDNILSVCYEQVQDINSTACQAVGRNTTSGAIDVPNPVLATNVNVGGLETSGIDLQVGYSMDLDIAGGSELSILFNATFLNDYDLIPIADLDTVNDCSGAFGRTCGEPKSETRTNTAINWTTGDLTLGLRHRWLDDTTLDEVRFGDDPSTKAVPELDGANYVDLSANYNVNENFEIWGGIINVFDEDPPLLGSRQVRANTSPDTFTPTGTEFFIGGSYTF
ncbi:MAG: TonB-dependent receptor [Gammaproteobacteria bacterium]|nr:TonB-dependent receptor [Gammaproteobacteria bacterium]